MAEQIKNPDPAEVAAHSETETETKEPPRNSIAEWAVTILLLLFGTTTLVQAFVIQTTNVSTLVSGLVSGVRYKLQINVVTTSGETLALWAFLGTIG